MPWDIKMEDDKHCVYKKGASSPIKGGCHATHEDAVKHMRALYANEPRLHSAVKFSEGMVEDSENENVKWIQAWRYSTWQHPEYGKVEITPQFGQQLKLNFDAGAYGQQLMLDFEHGLDRAKGAQSAADILDIDPRDDGVYYKVAFTDDALREIKERKWKYFSPEYAPEVMNAETEETYENVPTGGALTNRPFFKGMAPLNFSELFVENEVIIEEEEGGSTVDELTRKFAEALGIKLEDEMDEDAIIAEATKLNDVIEPLRKAKVEGERTKSFREDYPAEYAEHERLKVSQIERDALTFSENYSRFSMKDGEKEVKSNFGFSQLVKDGIAEIHKKFSDRTASHGDLKDLLDRIGDKGIVDYAEKGSSRILETERDENPTKAFSDLVLEIMKSDELEYESAMNMARSREPDLFMAYKNAIPQK